MRGLILLAVVCWIQLVPAAVVSYDIVYVRAPRPSDTKFTQWADVFSPARVEPGSDLVLLHPDGSEEVLVAAGAGAVADPCVSFDANWVYYSYLPDPAVISPITSTPMGGADIYKIHIPTRRIVRLTNQEFAPNTSVKTTPPYAGVLNMGPCPVADNKIVFTSNRYGFIPPKQYTPVTSQLFVMDDDGANVHAIAPMTLGAALHPFQMKDGRVAFSTQEAQGLRDNRVWGLWAIWPDGRKWEPLMSAFGGGAALHFAAQLSDGDVIVEDYYNLNNFGFGSFHRFPTENLPDVRFHPADGPLNPPLTRTMSDGNRIDAHYPFSPVGIRNITPFSTMGDEAAGVVSPGSTERLGKVTHPSGAPNNDLLLAWSPGPVNILKRPVNMPVPDAGIYIARDGGPVESPSDLVLIKNSPAFNEIWPRALVPYSAIYGVAQPVQLPFLPNDGTAHATLPAGTPYGIIGTSSFYKRESFPASVHSDNYITGGIHYDKLEPFNYPGDNVNSNWTIQGSDAGRYSNSEIDAVRILMMEPQTDKLAEGGSKFFNHVNERMRILGEIPLRKVGGNGEVIRDPEGNPDTSFWARIPADTPITFQMLDREGRVLTMAQTWHQVRPGEVRVDCGGCHSHSQTPLGFERTAAALQPPVDLTTTTVRDVEFIRDIRPLLQRSCVNCHSGDPASAPGSLSLDDTSMIAGVLPDTPVPSTPTDYARLARDRTARFGIKPPTGAHQNWVGANASRYVRIFQSRRSLLAWKLGGARTDGWDNSRWESTAPFTSDLARLLWDLDFNPGTVDHSTMLSNAEKRTVYAWIDLAAPVDLGGGYWRDENRPTLTVKVTNGVALVGAADAYSGLNESTVSLTVNGLFVALTKQSQGIWSAAVPAGSATLVATAMDNAGNITQQTLRIGPPPQGIMPRAPTGLHVQ